jgi:hypothetical protein
MKTNPLVSFFLWLSNTDEKLYSLCPQNVQRARISLGVFVLITGILGMVTGSYFIRSMFAQYNEITQSIEVSTAGWIASIVFGLLWGFLIVMIDREIVSAHSKWSAAIRIPLAIVIGLVLAIPFKVQFFSERINKELTIASRLENSIYEERKNTTIGDVNERIKNIEAKIDNERKQMAHWSSVMEAETVGRVQSGRTGKAGQGPAWEEAKRNYDLHQSFEQQYSRELQQVHDSKGDVIESATTDFEQAKIDQTYDFLSQYEQMEIIKENNKKLARFALLITMLFILIETIPAIMKLLRPSDEYDALLQVRTNISKQIAFAYGNFAIDEIANAQNISILSQKNFKFSPKEIIKQIALNML